MENLTLSFPPSLFVTGTDTGIGKTLVSAILVKGLGAAYWKPIQSGLTEETDTDWVLRQTGLPMNHFYVERYRLNQPLSPHLSARLDGVTIQLNDFEIPDSPKPHMIIEGAGGVMVPVNDSHFMIDMIRQFEVPVLVVARSGLGTINHTLLTLEQLNRRNIPIWGVVLNGKKNFDNKKAIERYGKAKVIAEITPMNHITPEELQKVFSKEFLK